SDVRSCVDALETIDLIDSSRIFLMGNTIGGSIALMAAAQDQRIAGVGVVAAFSPWRESNAQYESLRAWSHLHGFLPRLGWFADSPRKAPVDFGEIISCIAPRPVMIIAPSLDRYSDPEAVNATMSRVASVYGLYGKPRLVFQAPAEIGRMTMEMCRAMTDFYHRILKE
ncbi:MAG TPA: alpha/beta hydrolase, partial [Anseongella sp.]|nr:alpha/beta hydrolase [Anseongella sp.]